MKRAFISIAIMILCYFSVYIAFRSLCGFGVIKNMPFEGIIQTLYYPIGYVEARVINAGPKNGTVLLREVICPEHCDKTSFISFQQAGQIYGCPYISADLQCGSRNIDVEMCFDKNFIFHDGLVPYFQWRIIKIIEKKIAQQVDSAEASTIAVPPSEPSGSPR
jgi:hypothetical protein